MKFKSAWDLDLVTAIQLQLFSSTDQPFSLYSHSFESHDFSPKLKDGRFYSPIWILDCHEFDQKVQIYVCIKKKVGSSSQLSQTNLLRGSVGLKINFNQKF